jgi:glutamate/tyrosine decarboxylase-like PLP-dependent enzyme
MITDSLQAKFEKVQKAIAEGPITARVAPGEIRTHLQSRFDFVQPMDLEDAIVAVEEMMSEWQVHVTHPRYFGLFNPSVTFASTVADSLVAMYNPQLASWRTSPAANEIEKFTLDWLARKFGLPAQAIGNFTNGGAEANLSAVIVALTRAFPGYGDFGARSLHAAPAIYLTTEAHHSFAKIAHMTGIGRNALRKVATDHNLRMDLEDLAGKIEEDRAHGFEPFLVVGTAGTTAAGAIDPLPELGELCKAQGLWFHVDAAWGGAAILAPSLRNCLRGIEHADSITCDAHKWFSVPMGCGMFFCRHPESVLEAFRAEAAYMPGKANGAALDPYTSTVQWSRRFIGLKLFLSLVTHGESGYAEMIEHQAGMGKLLKKLLSDTGWNVVNETPLPLICFRREGLNVSRLLASLYDHQIAWMSEARIGGEPAIRACITSFRTTEQDIRQVVESMNRMMNTGSALQSAPAECR